jgi:hypothetical protein
MNYFLKYFLFTTVSIFISFVGTLLLFSFLLSLPVYLLWNGCLVDAVTFANKVTWLQAWGISILCSFLFKTYSIKSNDD